MTACERFHKVCESLSRDIDGFVPSVCLIGHVDFDEICQELHGGFVEALHIELHGGFIEATTVDSEGRSYQNRVRSYRSPQFARGFYFA